VLRFGGRVVKNVAGYDLTRLFAGSRGSLGLITALYLRLRGLPEHDATFAIQAAGPAEAAALATAVRDRLEPDAVEIIGPDPAGPWTVAVRLRGSEAGVGDGAVRLDDLDAGVNRLQPAAARDLWDRLAMSEADTRVGIRLGNLPAKLPDTIAAAVRFAALMSPSDNGLQSSWRVAAHAAQGIVRLWSAGEITPDTPLDGALSDLVADIANAGGTATCPVGPARLAARLAATSRADPAADRIAAQIKARFDPAGILRRGRLPDGLQ
jgi:glycolate oxidase FAD binding subunit